jgi:probable HAF family extracellular repeat protein
VVTGISENGFIDPQSGFPEFDAVVWKHGQVIDLGTFGGTFSYANAINDRSQVVGFALNGASDSFFMDECGAGPMPSQMRAFIWQEGSGLRDLGTLGGPDSCALWINQRGEVAGHSFTSFTADPATGVPPFDPFLWKNGKMKDLGSLGGTQGHASAINNRGQVAGDSNLTGDQIQHAFFWHHGKMQDLTPGRGFSLAHGLNDYGEVVGGTFSADGLSFNAFVWWHGVLTDLESVPGDKCDSSASSINSRGQIVGVSFPCAGDAHAAIWENGKRAIDLNTLVRPSSGLHLAEAQFINDRGEITGKAVLPNGDQHAFLLIPKDQSDQDDAITATQADVAPVTPRPTYMTHSRVTPAMRAALRARFSQRFRGFGLKPPK